MTTTSVQTPTNEDNLLDGFLHVMMPSTETKTSIDTNEVEVTSVEQTVAKKTIEYMESMEFIDNSGKVVTSTNITPNIIYTINFNNGSKYVGACSDKKLNGHGTIIFSNGETYIGEFKDNTRHGIGKYSYPNSRYYDGDWKNDKQHGTGKCIYSNGDIYEGEWKNDKQHGTGKYAFSNGDVYEGEWKDGNYNGIGKCIYSNGNIYEGEWKDDKRHGTGKHTSCTGDVYQGEWKDGKKHGTGKHIYCTGSVYEGEWKDGNKHGLGVYQYNDEHKLIYTCEFENNKPHGHGTITFIKLNDRVLYFDGEFRDGSMFKGVIYNANHVGKPVATKLPTIRNKYMYAGRVDIPPGHRTIYYNGLGVAIYPNGDIYKGHFKMDKRHGDGVLTKADGSVIYKGEWFEDIQLDML